MTTSLQTDAPAATLRAAAWMVGAIASFTTMAVGGRGAATVHDTFEIMLYRSCVGVVLVLAAIALTRAWHEVSLRNWRAQVVRNVAHFTGQNLWFLAITLAPLAQVIALEFTSPLWVLLLAPLLAGERVRKLQYAVALGGFAGVLLIVRPTAGLPEPGLAFAALAAIAFAITNLLTRRLTRTETVLGILIWLTGTQLLFGLATAGIDGQIAPPTAETAPWLVLVGLAGLGAHFCLTKALTLAPASAVIPIDFLRLPLIATIGALFYAEPLNPLVLLGGAIVLGAAWANLRLAPRP